MQWTTGKDTFWDGASRVSILRPYHHVENHLKLYQMPGNHVVTDISNLRQWKWRNTTGFQSSSWLTLYCWVAGLEKEVVWPLPWEPPLSLTGIQTSSWEHPVPVPNCSSWPTSTCLSQQPRWDTWEPGCPKSTLWNLLHFLRGREQDTLLHGSVLPQWDKDKSIKLSPMNVLRVY